MRITKYRTEINQNKHNVLVKESATNYCTDNFTDPGTISNMLNDCFGLNRLAEEHIYLIALSTKCKPYKSTRDFYTSSTGRGKLLCVSA